MNHKKDYFEPMIDLNGTQSIFELNTFDQGIDFSGDEQLKKRSGHSVCPFVCVSSFFHFMSLESSAFKMS